MGRNTLEMTELFQNTNLAEKVGMEKASESAHSQTTILNFCELIPLHGCGVLSETEWVESEISRSTVTFQGFAKGYGTEHLEEGTEEQNLRHSSFLDEEVVRLRGSHGFHTGESENLGEYISENTKHGDTALKHTRTHTHTQVK